MSSKKLYMFGVKNHLNGGYYVPCGTNYMLPIDGRLSKVNQVTIAKDKATTAKWTTENVVGFVICTIADRPDGFDLTEQDFISITATSDEVAAEPEPETETTKTVQIELPFMGFYESYHTEQPYEIMERELYDKVETITDGQHDDFWRIFHTEFDYKKYRQKTACFYAHWLVHKLDPNAVFTNIELHSPKEYNFTTDTITVTLARSMPNLTLDYFTENGLMCETLAVIKERYTSRDGFVSFVEPTPPTLESVFIEPAYRDCAFEVLVYHKFGMEYQNANYRCLLNELNTQFIDYMQEQGHYDDLFWDCLSKDLTDYLNGDTP